MKFIIILYFVLYTVYVPLNKKTANVTLFGNIMNYGYQKKKSDKNIEII